MKIVGDTHTHTVACQHAYSTLRENADYALHECHHRFMCTTEHTPGIAGSPSEMFFTNLTNAGPSRYQNLVIVRGAEVNVQDNLGHLALSENTMKKLEFTLAGIHRQCFFSGDGSKDYFTETWLNIAKNPYIDAIAHIGCREFEPDYETVIRAMRDAGKVIEINNHTPTSRAGSEKNCVKVVSICKKLEARICVSSDAHYCEEIGKYDWALKMLEDVDFPEELVINSSFDRFAAFVKERRGIILPVLE